MRLLAPSEHRELSVMLRALLAVECSTSMVRAYNASAILPVGLWKALAGAGVLGLAVAEEDGGSGGTLSDVGVLALEAGRALCPLPVHSTVLAGVAITTLGGADMRAAWLPALCAGDLRAATALWNPRDAADTAPVLTACADTRGWRLVGTVDFVSESAAAEVIVVSARADDRTLMAVVDLAAPGVHRDRLSLMGGHRACRVRFDDVAVAGPEAVIDVSDSRGTENLRRVANTSVALQSMDLVGIGEAVIERTVEYTRGREQFGRPIAAFQAAQHLVADMDIAVSAARLAAHAALFWLNRGQTATRHTAVARIHAATAATKITLDAHQLHGGMGYVTETDLHLWSERARVLSTLGGGPDMAARWLEGELDLAVGAPGTWTEGNVR